LSLLGRYNQNLSPGADEWLTEPDLSQRFEPSSFDLSGSDKALLAAFLLAALLGIWSHCLLLNDGAVLLSAGWLGSAWHIYFDQIGSRAVSVMTLFGPAWAARTVLGLGASAYMTVAHAFYFAVPLVLWLALRAIEGDRLFSRLYLASSASACG
jgi:hypothetical protein